MRKVVENRYVCKNSDWNVIGETLGFSWNHVCDLMKKEGLAGSDGSGFFILCDVSEVSDPTLKQIAKELLNQSSNQEIYVMDDF
jgi:hypothetical protein